MMFLILCKASLPQARVHTGLVLPGGLDAVARHFCLLEYLLPPSPVHSMTVSMFEKLIWSCNTHAGGVCTHA